MEELRKRIVGGIASALIGLAAVGVAIGFLSLAMFFSFATVMSAALAALLTGLIILAAAALAVVIIRLASRPRRTRQAHRAGTQPDDMAVELGKLFGEKARTFTARHPGGTILGSLAAGFILGMSPGLRDLFRRGL